MGRLSTPPAAGSTNKKKPQNEQRDGAVAIMELSSDDDSAEILSDCATDDCLSDSDDHNARNNGMKAKRVRFHHQKNKSTQFIEIGDLDDDEEMDSKFKVGSDGLQLETVSDGDALGTTNIMAEEHRDDVGLVENTSPR